MDSRDNCSGKMPAKLRLASDTKSLDNSVTCDPASAALTAHVSRVTAHSLLIIVRCGEGRDNLLFTNI